MKDEHICIVLNPAFGEFLKSIDSDTPVWVVQSSLNNAVVDELRKSGRKNLTTFRPQEIIHLLWAVDEHHPGWRRIEFHGHDVDEARRAVMREFGGGTFHPLGVGFIFERETTGAP